MDILQDVMAGSIPTLRQIGAQVPQALDDVIARALSRDLDTRYATAIEFAQAVERAAGPEQVGTHGDVARLMEAIFGPRMAQRQEHVRATLGPSELTDLLRESGLPSRDRISFADVPTGQLLAELAPPAPTGRYALGTEMRGQIEKLRPRRVPWWGAVAGGIAIGAAVTLAVVANRPRVAPIVVRGSPPVVVASAAVPPAPPARKVVLPLPFVASHVSFDDQARELMPATDVAAFDVPGEAGLRHRVSITALDGSRAEGYVREQDGIARPDEGGFTMVMPDPVPGDTRPAAARPARPIGTVHNGFTKLR